MKTTSGGQQKEPQGKSLLSGQNSCAGVGGAVHVGSVVIGDCGLAALTYISHFPNHAIL